MKQLTERDLLPDPISQFARWYEEAMFSVDISYANAMTVSTIGQDGYPQGRIVLLKSFSLEGFVFYTNMNSEKGAALGFTPKAALTFYWDPLGRQVRVQGDTSLVADAVADAYFQSRDRESQIGAWASDQSKPLSSREELEARFEEYAKKFDGQTVPRPSHWTGVAVKAKRFEFWQFGPHRLHDRFSYERVGSGEWKISRLNP